MDTRLRKAAPATRRREVGSAAFPALVTGAGGDPAVVDVHAGPGGGARPARLALAAPYRAAVGDRVLVIAGDGDDPYVIGVLHADRAPSLALPDGGSVTVRGEAAELRDAAGRLIVRYENGSAEIAAPAGDLVLSAPEGRVVVRAGLDVEIEAARDLRQTAGHRAEVEAPRVEVRAGESHVASGQVSVVADRIATTAGALIQSVERYELTATRLVETAQDTYREAIDLCQTRAGRVRAIVQDVYALYSRRTTMASRDDTSIDGKRVLLG